jgi:hypothetical protein
VCASVESSVLAGPRASRGDVHLSECSAFRFPPCVGSRKRGNENDHFVVCCSVNCAYSDMVVGTGELKVITDCVHC